MATTIYHHSFDQRPYENNLIIHIQILETNVVSESS